MGHIKEPEGIDFAVDPTPLTKQERKQISEIIAYYKATGKKMLFQKKNTKKSELNVDYIGNQNEPITVAEENATDAYMRKSISKKTTKTKTVKTKK